MAEKANLVEIFKSLKSRRLKLLQFLWRGRAEDNIPIITPQAHDLTVVLNELKLNEEHLVELSTKLLKNNRARNSKFKEIVNSSLSEIRSSLHWLDVISTYYKGRKTG